jgi:hypothetical protein
VASLRCSLIKASKASSHSWWILSLGYVLLGLAGLLVLFEIYLIVLQPTSGH